MKHTFIGNNLEGLTDMEINVLQVALTHLIEDLQDHIFSSRPKFKGRDDDTRLEISKKLYLDLGGKEFWK